MKINEIVQLGNSDGSVTFPQTDQGDDPSLDADGFTEDAVEKRLSLRYCPSMAECILAERDERQYATIVVGRQGLSRKEEFLFGSISSKIVNHARHCTVWVVE